MVWRCYRGVAAPDKPSKLAIAGRRGQYAAMSLYALQKLIRDVNRKPACREAFFQSAESFANGYDLAEPERDALIKRDVRTLYAMGVHGLLLRPFTLLHQMPEPDYLKAIRGE